MNKQTTFRSVAVLVAVVLMAWSNVQAQKIQLFNGKNLDGWTIYGTEKWYVEDGNLISESGPDKEYGYLGTNEYYKDFILTVEFLQESNGNSGVFIRSTVDGVKVKGWQVEVAPSGQHTGGIYESYGRGWLIKPEAEKEKVLKEGEWNKMKIKVKGGRVTSWLNGTKMVDIEDDKIAEGEGGVALQIHSGGNIKVRWRNLELKQL